jgi:AcrR family transcriptional regulator
MSPRSYRTQKRREAAEETRGRVLAATRRILAGSEGLARLSIDAVAEKAGVARMTVYYQFGSKAGLLEAFFDALADRGPFRRMPAAMSQQDPERALDDVVSIFGEFWERNRAEHGRLFAAARLDRDLERAMRQRNERRRAVMRTLVERMGPWRGRGAARRRRELVDALFALTGFSVFEALAVEGRTLAQIVAIVQRVARATVQSFRA